MHLDTAFIARCYLAEAGSEAVREAARRSSGLASARLGRAEFWSVVCRHARERRLDARVAARAREMLVEDERQGVWTWYAVGDVLLDLAARNLERLPASIALGASDAIHLTCAQLNGFDTVYTNDARMLRAARHFGLRGVNLLAEAGG